MVVLGEAVIGGGGHGGGGGGGLASIHTALNRKDWFFLCSLAHSQCLWNVSL